MLEFAIGEVLSLVADEADEDEEEVVLLTTPAKSVLLPGSGLFSEVVNSDVSELLVSIVELAGAMGIST